MRTRLLVPAALVLPLAALAGQGGGKDGPAAQRRLLDAADRTPISDDVRTVMGQPGYMATVKEGRDAWPGVRFAAKPDPWDLSAYAYVSAGVYNNGLTPLRVLLRVEDAGSSRKGRWNEESVTIPVGAWREVHAFFGYGDGFRKGYRLDASRVTGVTIVARPEGAPQAGQRGIVVAGVQAEGTRGQRATADLPGFSKG